MTSPPSLLARDERGVIRCAWCGSDPLYVRYHDREWGFPVRDDRKLFEKLCLEGFQAGLAWITILRKREAFRAAFRDFELERVARFGPKDVERLLADPGIVRHRGKIEAAIGNARAALGLIERHGSLAAFLWGFEPPERPFAVRARSPESEALSRALRSAGFRFVGPTTCYAFLQAMGLVDDHVPGCAVRPLVEAKRRRFRRPAGRGPARG